VASKVPPSGMAQVLRRAGHYERGQDECGPGTSKASWETGV